ncbi:cytochrome c-type biogenesis protein CcmH [Thalassotalea euphylliae]|uniref:cytochrome c-type biogenesis protein n=1 Tax=Thalassotalea euphylliae TaxID=1655234 RepID=UPI00363C6BE3
MNVLHLVITLALLAVFGMKSVVADDKLGFADPVMEKRYQSLIKDLRCPKCQNQNLADSNSQISIDLRNEVYTMLEQGKADMEITNYMVDRYGEFVLYRPKVNQLTYVLWFGPAIVLLVGVIVIVVIARRRSASRKELSLSSEQQQQLNEILKEKE